MKRLYTRLAFAGLALATSAAQATGSFSFGVFGDTPYNQFERLHLPRLIAEMDAEPLAFVVHDGDIKNGGERCDDALFQDRLGVFQGSMHPFVFVPGDNEWTDCHRPSNGRFDPLERLDKLRSLFFPEGGRRSLGQSTIPLETQADGTEFPAYKENQRWMAGPVIFVSVNVTGSANNFGPDPTPGVEFLKRGKAVHAWLEESFARAREEKAEGLVIVMQANPDIEDFSAGRRARGYQEVMTQLLTETRRFTGQVLLVHGDSHLHRIDQPLRDPADGSPVENFTRLETYGSPFMGWVRVTVEPGRQPLFRYQSRPYTPHQEGTQ